MRIAVNLKYVCATRNGEIKYAVPSHTIIIITIGDASLTNDYTALHFPTGFGSIHVCGPNCFAECDGSEPLIHFTIGALVVTGKSPKLVYGFFFTLPYLFSLSIVYFLKNCFLYWILKVKYKIFVVTNFLKYCFKAFF